MKCFNFFNFYTIGYVYNCLIDLWPLEESAILNLKRKIFNTFNTEKPPPRYFDPSPPNSH